MTGPLSNEEYFLEIESHFAARRGTPFVFSAKDWALLKSWREEGIPLPVVIEAIDSCFDRRLESGRKAPISSLRYCRHAVRELWDERKDLAVGAESALPERDPQALLAALAADLRQAAEAAPPAIRGVVAGAAEAVDASKGSVPQLEERLLQIEEQLMTGILEALPPDQRREIEAEVERLLAGYAGGKEDVIRKTRDANLKRLLRLRLGLPRLSLFR